MAAFRSRLNSGARATSFITCAVGLLAAVFSTEVQAQPVGKIPRVGVLVIGEKPGELPAEAFRLGMRDLGYVDGQNIVLEWRYAHGRTQRLPVLAAELIGLGVDLLYCAGPDPAIAAKAVTSTIPIVVVGARDPVAEGWAASLGRPGGNITGFLVAVPGLFGKNLSLLKEAAPRIARVAVLSDSGRGPEGPGALKELEEAARQLGLQLHPVGVKGPADFEGAFKAARQWRADGLISVETAMLFAHRTMLAALVRRHRLPAIALARQTAEAGFLLSNGADIADQHRRAATYVDKILKGAQPGDLPFQQPERLELVINLKTAKALSLTLPQSLLLRANNVLE
jgi:putative tryptophan/tyrosine transport system substrate-binding protein